MRINLADDGTITGNFSSISSRNEALALHVNVSLVISMGFTPME